MIILNQNAPDNSIAINKVFPIDFTSDLNGFSFCMSSRVYLARLFTREAISKILKVVTELQNPTCWIKIIAHGDIVICLPPIFDNPIGNYFMLVSHSLLFPRW